MRARPLTALALGWLLAVATTGAGAAPPATTVKIGVIADVTGPAAAYGTSQKNAVELAADDLKAGRIDAGGASLVFNLADAAGDAGQAAGLAQNFVEDGSALLLGPTLSGEARQADPIAVRANLTIIADSNAAPGLTSLGPCVFRDALGEDQLVPQTVERAVLKWRPRTAALVYGGDNQFTKRDYALFKTALERRHVAIVDVETYRTGDSDFRPALRKVAAAKPDILVVAALLEEAVRIVVQARQAGIASHFIGGNGFNSPRFIELAGNAGEGAVFGAAYFAGNAYAGNSGFVERYVRRFGVEPDQFSAQAYAAAQLAAAAVKSGATTSGGICAALKNVTRVSTVLGPINFLPSRELRGASAIVMVSKGSFAYFT